VQCAFRLITGTVCQQAGLILLLASGVQKVQINENKSL
jgi:hypothetical protein